MAGGRVCCAQDCGSLRLAAIALGGPALVAGTGNPAHAHASESIFVLTLPTDLYIAGGTMVVAVSFLLVALVPAARARALDRLGRPIGSLPRWLGTAVSLASFALLVALVLAGLLGPQDPLANPLPLAIWTLWWVGLTLAHALLGDLWSALNPWRGLYQLLTWVPGLGAWIARPPLRYPAAMSYAPAIVLFIVFAWFELIFTVPQAPEILAKAVTLYFVLNLIGILLFGMTDWLRYGEAFSVFFRVVSWLSPLNGRPEGSGPERGGGRREIFLALPGAGLLQVRPLPMSGVAFIILALSAVSFDGLSKTFWWLELIGVNPLLFPGRSAVALANSLGLLALYAALLGAFCGTIWLGHVMAGRTTCLADSLGATVLSIVPIALGYHFAHYLTAFMVGAQYAAITFNDPLGRGWDLFGLAGRQVTTSFLYDFESVRLIWHGQVAAIVTAHVVAVATAHLLAVRRTGQHKTAIISQIPVTVLMVGYTMFGLWLLSSPTAG